MNQAAPQSTRKFFAWIASLAILLAALAPSISHALAAANDDALPWAEICSTTIGSFAKVADGQNPGKSSSPAEKTLQPGHCLFCLTHMGAFGLPPAAVSAFLAVNTPSAFPSRFYQSPRPLFIWTVAQSRAPPLAS